MPVPRLFLKVILDDQYGYECNIFPTKQTLLVEGNNDDTGVIKEYESELDKDGFVGVTICMLPMKSESVVAFSVNKFDVS